MTLKEVEVGQKDRDEQERESDYSRLEVRLFQIRLMSLKTDASEDLFSSRF